MNEQNKHPSASYGETETYPNDHIGWFERLLLWIVPKKRIFNIEKEVDGVSHLYLRRFRLIENKWFRVFLHKILLPDLDRHRHNHPWNFLTFVLSPGTYWEKWSSHLKPMEYIWRETRWWRSHKAKDYHKIEHLDRVPTWTLVFCGKKINQWGFYDEEKKEWVHWFKYLTGEEMPENYEPLDPDSIFEEEK